MTGQLKIGFIQSKNEIDVNWFKPLAFGYLKNYLEKYLEVPVEMYFLENLRSIEEFDVIGISSTSQDFAVATEIARSIKQKKEKIITILGGHHITYLPQTLPKEVDIGVIGEGEQTFLELVRLFCDNSLQIKPEDLEKIDGIVFHGDGGPAVTSCRKLIEPLDNIPIPFRPKSDKTYLFTSRGCPYKCAFCSSSAFWKKTRFFSAEYVVDEIESLLCQFPKLRHISIWDDLFIANLPRLRKIVKLLVDKRINKKVGFDLAVRANLVNDELCELLKTMNVTSVAFGAESASNRILKLLNKGVTVETNQRAIDTLYRYGFPVGCSLVIGCPSETEEEVRNTYEFILKNIKEGKIAPNCAVNILSPMPGTKIWDNAVKDGLIDIQNIDWARLAVFASYRNSNTDDFGQWLQCRRKNNSIYLAESSLPQKRLYKLMSHYEQAIKELEMGIRNPYLKKPAIASKKLAIRFLPEGTLRRKIAKAFYLLIFNRDRFKKSLKILLNHSRHHGIKSIYNNPVVSKKNEPEGQTFHFPESALAHKYCVGKGLEIGGSAHNPFGLNTLNVDFTDSMDTTFKKEEVKLCGQALGVDIVANGDDIPLADESQDFVVSSHVIEHFPDPIKALIEWDRLVKPGGIIFMIVPHKERTFDKEKDCTPLEHLVEDFRNHNTQSHDDPNGHDHCWVTDTFVELIKYMIENLGMQWEIVEVQDIDDKVGNGFTVVIRKIKTKERTCKACSAVIN
jgi:anaerobic magnesium-protoporphyrin IX monomethyl ester cyclase